MVKAASLLCRNSTGRVGACTCLQVAGYSRVRRLLFSSISEDRTVLRFLFAGPLFVLASSRSGSGNGRRHHLCSANSAAPPSMTACGAVAVRATGSARSRCGSLARCGRQHRPMSGRRSEVRKPDDEGQCHESQSDQQLDEHEALRRRVRLLMTPGAALALVVLPENTPALVRELAGSSSDFSIEIQSFQLKIQRNNCTSAARLC